MVISTAKNTFYLFSAYVFQKIVALFYFIVLARYLGAAGLGQYTFAFSFAALFSILVDFGLSPVLIREISRDKDKSEIYLGNVLGFKLFSSLLGFGLIILMINLMGYPSMVKNLVYLASLVMILDNLSFSLYSTFRGYFNLKYESLGLIIQKIVIVVSGAIFILLKAPLIVLILPVILGSLFYLINALILAKVKLHLPIEFHFNKEVLKLLLQISWPFFVTGIFAQIFGTADTILLSYLGGDKFVGWYNAAQKIPVAVVGLIPAAFGATLFPSFSYYFVNSPIDLKRLLEKSIFYLTIIALPIIIGGFILADQIILLFYGQDYQPSILTLKIFIWALFFMFLDYPLNGLLYACNRQKPATFIRGVATAIFVILNLILIPKYFQIGSAIAALISFFILFILEVYWTKKIVSLDKKYLFDKFSKILLASLAMGLLIILIQGQLPINKFLLIPLILVSSLVYFLILYLSGVLTKEEIKSVKDLVVPAKFSHLFLWTKPNLK